MRLAPRDSEWSVVVGVLETLTSPKQTIQGCCRAEALARFQLLSNYAKDSTRVRAFVSSNAQEYIKPPSSLEKLCSV